MMNLLGCSKENFFKLMKFMNYRKDNNNVDVYTYRGYRKEKSKVKFVNKKEKSMRTCGQY